MLEKDERKSKMDSPIIHMNDGIIQTAIGTTVETIPWQTLYPLENCPRNSRISSFVIGLD